MVWWVDTCTRDKSNKTVHTKFSLLPDRLFQSVNIMFNLNQQDYTVQDIYRLMHSGVNIFNVDRTVHDDKFCEALKNALNEAVKMPEMYPPLYLRPVGLSVTMSTTEPVDVDERTDFIILKNVSSMDQVIDYKIRNMELAIPFLLQISEYCTDELTQFIKISDGIVFDFSELSNAVIAKVSNLCKKHEKPLFYLKYNIFNGINRFDNNRKLLAVASVVVDSHMDGVVIAGDDTTLQTWIDVILNINEALKLTEDRRDLKKEHSMLRLNTKLPQMIPITMMIATSLAALTVKACAILLVTASGRSARMLSSINPPCSVIAVTARDSLVRQLHLYRNVIPLHYEGRRAVNWREECRNRVRFGTVFATRAGLFSGGAKLVVLAPFEEGAACCNSIQIVSAPLRCAK